MLVKGERASPRGVISGVILIVLGLALGVLRPWETWGGGAITPVVRTALASGGSASNGGLPAGLPDPDTPNGLPELELELSNAAVAQLQRERQAGLQRGVIVRDSESMVPATVTYGGKQMAAEVRLKGDTTDHIITDKWSLRIELEEGSVLGMRRFSIQHPRTRSYLLEWIMLEAARRDGLLAPRATFVNVKLNGANRGVYYLEEHFAKELLESQGRREGPIVHFNESTMWGTRLRHRTLTAGTKMPQPVISAELPVSAEAEAVGERRLSSVDALNRQLDSALEKLRELQERMAASENRLEMSRRLDAERLVRAETIDEILNVHAAAGMHALATLFRREHGLYWHNVRFYHDPVRQRLEPIVYDASSGVSRDRDPFSISSDLFREFLASDHYRIELFAQLSRLSRPEYLEDFIAAVSPQVEIFERAMQEEGILPANRSAANIFEELRDQQLYLLELVNPPDAVNFDARWVHSEASDGVDGGELVVNAWATTQVPVIIEGFRFANGSFIRAESAHDRDAAGVLRLARGAIVLPTDGRRHTFRFPIDERLAALRRIEEEKSVARTGETPAMAMPEITAEFHTAADQSTMRELLVIRRLEEHWAGEGGRPPAPTLEEALERHAFLAWDPAASQLVIEPGDWRVEQDLVLPEGMALSIAPGAHLSFRERTALIATGPLLMEGSAEQPIVLESSSPGESFDGVAVMDAGGQSVWRHVIIRRAGQLQRSGWIMTGGVTFYHSPVVMRECVFEDARGEDALNIFGSAMELERTRFSGAAGDGLDADFATGSVSGCTFERTAADALEASSARLEVRNCSFAAIGDKCIAASGASEVTVEGGRIAGASIGVASRDGARVTVRGLAGKGIINYALAAYSKDAEHAPSRIEASDVNFDRPGRDVAIAQTDHEVIIDGKPVPTQSIDVNEMYRQKILGQ